MASTTTTYGFLLPTVGSDTNLWGGYLNSNFNDIDDLFDGTTPVTGIDINGGSIDGTPIGAASASTGAFTTGYFSNDVGLGDASGSARLVVGRLGGSYTQPAINITSAIVTHPGTTTTTSGSAITILAGNAANSALYFGDTDNGSIGAVRYDHADNSIKVIVNSLQAINITNTGTVTISTVDINGGAIDGTPIGASSASAGAFTTLTASGTATFGTIDINGGAIDGTSIGASSASTGAFTTLTASGTATFGTIDINGGAIDGTPIGASSASTGAFTTLTASGDVAVNTNTLFVDVSANSVGIGTASPTSPLHVIGTTRATGPHIVQSIADAATGLLRIEDSGGNNAGQLAVYSLDGAGAAGEWRFQSTIGNILFQNTGDISYIGSGSVGIGTSSPNSLLHTTDSTNSVVTRLANTNATFTSRILSLDATRSGSSAYDFAQFYSNTAAPDLEFAFSGDGNGTCDGSWTGGGADYAEYFEWEDGNPNGEDRRGVSVVLVGTKIRQAAVGETPIGVVSGNPSVVGDGDIGRWKNKYLSDDFGTTIEEQYEAIDDSGNVVLQYRRKLNPAYDDSQAYVPRSERNEWDVVGLIGKLRVRTGQETASTWIKMRDVSDTVEEWFVK